MPRPEFFLSHASADKESVKAIAGQLKQLEIPTWLDEWNLIPGVPWAEQLDKALRECAGCIVFFGPGGAGHWRSEEVRTALDLAARGSSYRLIPVLLPGVQREQILSFVANRPWVDFSKGLDDPDAIHHLVCGIRGIEPGASADGQYPRGANPYRGLRVFDVDHTSLFFGREALTQELLSKIPGPGSVAPRFGSIVGPSGSGKSSLARAGLLASLRNGTLPGSAQWPQVIIRPLQDPLGRLATGIVSKLAPSLDPRELIGRFRSGEEALHLQVQVALQEHPEQRLVLLVDQAEEAFTLCTNVEDRGHFFANLIHAATTPGGQTVVVLALRADFYALFAENRELAKLVSGNQLLVPPMSEDELRRAIALPAERNGRPVRPALVDELLAESKGKPAPLPLLEHALAQLWDLPRPELDLDGYHSIGKLAGALNARAESVFASLTPSQQDSCRRLFLRLVQQNEGALETKRRVAGAELPADQREVSQAFAAEGVHLLIWSREGDREFLEVAHEELFRRWGRLQGWVAEDRSGQRIHRRLTAAAADWSDRPAGARESFVFRGAALAEVEEWLASLPNEERSNLLNSQEAAFLEESRAAEIAARIAAAENATKAARYKAETLARELIANAEKSLERDPQLSLLLIQKAASIEDTPHVRDAVLAYVRAPGRAVLRHSGPVRIAAFSPDGKRVVTASNDSTAQLWDVASGKRLAELRGHSDWVNSAAFSPNGECVVTASDDRTARLWGAASGKQFAELRGHSGSVWSAAFSPDGQHVVTASSDSTARLWDAASGKQLAELRGHSDSVRSAAFSPNGQCVITASDDRTARLWDAASGRQFAELRGHSRMVNSVTFSPDGQHVVTASSDSTARLWDAASGKQLAELRGHSDWVRSAAFSPDGQRVVTASYDSTARLWDAASGKQLVELRGYSGRVWSAAFSPEGQRVVTASRDSTARIWDAASGKQLAELRGHSGEVDSAAFSPDGQRIITASLDSTTRIWDAASGKQLAELRGHSGEVNSAAFSPDGQRVVTASSDNTARIWDAASGKQLAELRGHSDKVRSAAFSPDGQRVVTASYDFTARIWDVSAYTIEHALRQDPGRDFTPAERREYLHEDCAEPAVLA